TERRGGPVSVGGGLSRVRCRRLRRRAGPCRPEAGAPTPGAGGSAGARARAGGSRAARPCPTPGPPHQQLAARPALPTPVVTRNSCWRPALRPLTPVVPRNSLLHNHLRGPLIALSGTRLGARAFAAGGWGRVEGQAGNAVNRETPARSPARRMHE